MFKILGLINDDKFKIKNKLFLKADVNKSEVNYTEYETASIDWVDGQQYSYTTIL